MAERKAYPLRVSAEVLDSMQRWADDELRSLNAQIEYVLREALRQHGRIKAPSEPPVVEDDSLRGKSDSS